MYNIENANLELVSFLFVLLCLTASLVWPFLYCYYANLTTIRVASIDATIFYSNWFDYPVELQKYMILIIARSQIPCNFIGLGLFSCTLEVFGKSIKTSFSYYMLFRGLAKEDLHIPASYHHISKMVNLHSQEDAIRNFYIYIHSRPKILLRANALTPLWKQKIKFLSN